MQIHRSKAAVSRPHSFAIGGGHDPPSAGGFLLAPVDEVGHVFDRKRGLGALRRKDAGRATAVPRLHLGRDKVVAIRHEIVHFCRGGAGTGASTTACTTSSTAFTSVEGAPAPVNLTAAPSGMLMLTTGAIVCLVDTEKNVWE